MTNQLSSLRGAHTKSNENKPPAPKQSPKLFIIAGDEIAAKPEVIINVQSYSCRIAMTEMRGSLPSLRCAVPTC
ncbi:MAG: hypothetical protein ABIR03_00675 [Ginsengibacter sp.]